MGNKTLIVLYREVILLIHTLCALLEAQVHTYISIQISRLRSTSLLTMTAPLCPTLSPTPTLSQTTFVPRTQCRLLLAKMESVHTYLTCRLLTVPVPFQSVLWYREPTFSELVHHPLQCRYLVSVSLIGKFSTLNNNFRQSY